ncbi:hypothetical protein [Streptomyces xanthophaeus]|uniref:hypothetical protein n=1 Tax=Streptomyces xanthophaeus TaxID=67385 RepID=UPI001F33D920|nr:hypothetical protein [Streptomyces xanthophaeus]
MSSVHQIDPFAEEALPQLTGTWSLILGTAAVAAVGCPLLPEFVPNLLRYVPLYFILPLGIWAVISGGIALRRVRGVEGASRIRARAGIVLGTLAVVTAVAAIVWACWALSHI